MLPVSLNHFLIFDYCIHTVNFTKSSGELYKMLRVNSVLSLMVYCPLKTSQGMMNGIFRK